MTTKIQKLGGELAQINHELAEAEAELAKYEEFTKRVQSLRRLQRRTTLKIISLLNDKSVEYPTFIGID